MESQHTFVICAYGESAYLEKCIQSLKNQTLKSQVICYTSTPNKLITDLCHQYDIELFTKEGGGIGRDWNNALSFAAADYVTIAHQDDIYCDSYAEQVTAAFRRFPNSSIVYSDYAEYKDGKEILSSRNLKIKRLMLNVLNMFPNSKFWRNRVLAFGNAISCPAVTYNVPQLQNFEFKENFRTNLDWYAWYDISTHFKGRFTYVKQILMYHRIHEDSETSATISDNTRTKEDLEIYQMLWPNFIAKFLIKFYKKSQKSNF